MSDNSQATVPEFYSAFLKGGPNLPQPVSLPLPPDGRPAQTYTDPADGSVYELDLSAVTHMRGVRNMPTYRFTGGGVAV
jgi:hypothetical protein